MKPAIFLDRDGVIIENKDNYVRSWDDVEIYDQALKALAQFRSVPFYFIIVTNQSVVGRGIISKHEADAINQRLVKEIQRAGGRIDAVYMCPHAPADDCNCRKPKPGLFFQAASEYAINMRQSIMIGDALTDLTAAYSATVNRQVLVCTGRGSEQRQLNTGPSSLTYATYETLLDAFQGLFKIEA